VLAQLNCAVYGTPRLASRFGAQTVNAIVSSLLAAALAWVLIGLYRRAMLSHGRLEAPTERGMHSIPVPSGAGAAIVAAVLLLWPISRQAALEPRAILLLGTFAALAALSWLDDRGGLSPAVRLLAHAAAVTVLLVSLTPDQRVLPALPLAAERALMGLAWLWFINLFNFMDGIDGIAGGEAVAVAAGYLVVAGLAGVGGPLQDLALIVAAATAGFLIWNWHPARVFMGDTGSIALGFLLGWLMIDLACRGLWAAAAILPLYFVADATLTLGRRLARGEKPWRPHRQHFYQRAVLGGATPAAVVLRVCVANAALMALAVLSIRHPLPALVGAAAVVGALLVEMQRLANRRSR
jgi:UDP-N-acetylmuramyl pentapeptide phosphotransferase/UDP-N-acetylglucosamine-1-phosphate transferase